MEKQVKANAYAYALFDNLFLTPEELKKVQSNSIEKYFFKELKEFPESNLMHFYTLASDWVFIVRSFKADIIGNSEDVNTFLKNLPIIGLLNPKTEVEILSLSCSAVNQIYLDEVFLPLTPNQIPEELIGYLKIKNVSYIPEKPIRICVQLIGYLEKQTK